MLNTTVSFSDLKNRLDAEFYKATDSLTLTKLVADDNLGAVLKSCNRGKQPVYSKENTDFYVVKTKDVDGYFCKTATLEPIVELNYKSNNLAQLKPGDVVLNSTGVGSVCRPAIWYSDQNAIVDGHVTILRTGSTSISSELLFAYLRSNIGQQLLEREVSGGTGQVELYPDGIRNVKFPSVLSGINKKVKELVLLSHKSSIHSVELRKNAELLLNQHLQIEMPSVTKQTFVTTFNDLESRLDAGYYHPSYADLQEALGSHSCSVLDKVITEGSTGKAAKVYLTDGVPILKVRNVRNGYIDFSNTDFVALSFLKRHSRAELKKYDIIITSTGEGSIGKVDWFISEEKCCIVPELTKISPDQNKIWPGYLYLFLSSWPGKLQFMREISKATGQTHLYLDDYRSKLRVPLIASEVQKKIHLEVEESMNEYITSLRLMKSAIRLIDETLDQYLRRP